MSVCTRKRVRSETKGGFENIFSLFKSLRVCIIKSGPIINIMAQLFTWDGKLVIRAKSKVHPSGFTHLLVVGFGGGGKEKKRVCYDL